MYRSLFVKTCESPVPTGNRQSPIDITTDTVIHDSKKCKKSSLKLEYHSGDCHEVIILPTEWMLRTSDTCKTTLTASHLPGKFRLLQVHGHWGETADSGSEHSVNNKRFAGEVHFVFWNTNYDLENYANHPDGMAVLAVFLKEGKYHPEYGHITGSILEAVTNKTGVRVVESFDLTKLLPKNLDYVFYEGGLTTPPYTECVLWTVLMEPVEVSINQMRQFRRVGVKDNCREVQALCGRSLYSSCNLSKS
ncbi:unnamed protein product [Cylicocyclus nassatus]|uniref:Carbonic anhydrase n=1 Tax=Cylicocyclus nassatus TaxID=53992 RepID=A0AA36HGF7_CYLNA|nr:unnamed protein product [Cylicocyclus nassatus]